MKNNPVLIEVGFDLNVGQKQLFRTLKQGSKSFLLDVSQVEHSDIDTLSLLTQTQMRLHKQGYTLALINPSAYLRTWLYVTKLHRVIPSFPNLSLGNQYLHKLQKQA